MIFVFVSTGIKIYRCKFFSAVLGFFCKSFKWVSVFLENKCLCFGSADSIQWVLNNKLVILKMMYGRSSWFWLWRKVFGKGLQIARLLFWPWWWISLDILLAVFCAREPVGTSLKKLRGRQFMQVQVIWFNPFLIIKKIFFLPFRLFLYFFIWQKK